jgi:hypothetical protein
MASKNRIDVNPAETGEWRVVVSNGKESTHSFRRARDAELAARRIARDSGGGEVVIHSRSGRIRDVRMVPSSQSDS